jgi:dCMP deaminase
VRAAENEVLMQCAVAWSRRGTCSRLQVGAVAALEGRILSTGYNGAPSGLPHCEHGPDGSLNAPCKLAVHAEANVVAWAARRGISLEAASLFTTHEPCLWCARIIVNSGIRIVYYATPYPRESGLSLLDDAGLEIIHVGMP